MYFRIFSYGMTLFITIFFFTPVFACESCIIPRLGRDEANIKLESEDKKWFLKYIFEQQDWGERSASEAHSLHDTGHHVHNKTKEDFHHFIFGGHFTSQLIIFAEIPYVVKYPTEIEDHDRLGANEKSEGMGDLTLIGDYPFFQSKERSFSLVGGVKFPTGEINERNSVGAKFEPELQPGTGSFDYIFGGVYQHRFNRYSLVGNAAYVFKTQGAQDFEFGDLFSTSWLVAYLINPGSKKLKTKVGIDANYQYEQKQEDKGSVVKDSGGQTLLLGPTLSVVINDNLSILGSSLYPVYQDWGGVHQEVDLIWTLGWKLNW